MSLVNLTGAVEEPVYIKKDLLKHLKSFEVSFILCETVRLLNAI